MNTRPPVQSLRQELPFHDSAFGWDTFEDFFCDFLNAQPIIVLNEGGNEIRQRVIRARPFGRKGDSQYGIDLVAEMDNGETWEFQCKHYNAWGPQDTRDAIAAYSRNAPRRFLLITREVSEQCFAVVEAHQNWVLWDSREINRSFRALQPHLAAPILFTHFGPGWAEAFFGISGDGPFIGAEAKYERHLRENIRFHHRHVLVGRESLLNELDSFVGNDRARVYALTGRGGLGKSRLFLEWSRNFHQRHPNYILRFLSDKCTDFAPYLRTLPRPLVLVFDDAHRLNDVRRALFHELPQLADIKLVLSLRPGPIGQVLGELLDAGFDTTEIINAEPLRSLNSEQALQLVDNALKPEHTRYRHFLSSVSRDCPLVAIVSAELINAGALSGSELINEMELRRRVFDSLLDDARHVRERFGQQTTDDFLRLLALLGPVAVDAQFFERAARFLNVEHPDRLSHLRDSLDGLGLLHATGAGTRVTPDLLSDHLAYTACYDPRGESRTFAERVLEHFSPSEFPKILQHLAEAEWRALDENPNSASVIEPLWRWFRERFENSSFYDRNSQISEWANIAYLQPERSLELAQLAVSAGSAPPHPSLHGNELDSYEHSLESLPKTLANVAEHHPDKVARCFDLLWNIGRDQPADPNWNKGHAISLIGDVVAFKLWKDLAVHLAAIDWFERLVTTDELRQHRHGSAWLLSKFFEPMFESSIEENWSTGRTFHIRPHHLHLENTAPVRDRILQICRKLLEKNDQGLASDLIPILDKACDIARLGYGDSPSASFNDQWDVERLKALAVIEELAQRFPEPLIHFQIRRKLMHHVRYGNKRPAFQASCRRILHSLSDNLEVKIARATFSYDHEEFDIDSNDPNWQVRSKARWTGFIDNVTGAILDFCPSAADWMEYFSGLSMHWEAFEGYRPNFRHLLVRLAERNPAEGVRAVEALLGNPQHRLLGFLDAILIASTRSDLDERIRLIRVGAESESEEINAATVYACARWRREGTLDDAIWPILKCLASRSLPKVTSGITDFIHWNIDSANQNDWLLLQSLTFESDEVDLAGKIAATAARFATKVNFSVEKTSIELLLSRFENLTDANRQSLKRAFITLAKVFPEEIFLMLWRRNEARKAGNMSLKVLPYDFEDIKFPKIMESDEVGSLIRDIESRIFDGDGLDYDEIRLLRSVIQCRDEDTERWLTTTVERTTTEAHLETLLQLASVGSQENAAIAYPKFATTFLARARGIGPEVYRAMLGRLSHLSGIRGSTNGEPDQPWKALFQRLEKLAKEFESEPELGPLYRGMVEGEKHSMEFERVRMRSFEDGE